MLSYLFAGEYLAFFVLLGAIIVSLSLHEFGHAASATALGDSTPVQAGRLTLNPVAHIDILGLLMVILVSFGYAKPVPFNPRQIRHAWGAAAVAAAGPAMNLLLAIISINAYIWTLRNGVLHPDSVAAFVLLKLAQVNLLLMLFNLIPLGPLDGHYILSWLLPPRLGYQYDQFNARWGSLVFIGLILLSVAGVPVFRVLTQFAGTIVPYLTFV